MKQTLSIFLLVLSTAIVAQSTTKVTGDKHFERLEYAEAVKEYLVDMKKGDATQRTYERLAISYEKMADYKGAARFYKRLAKGQKAAPRNIYKYAQMLKATGDFNGFKSEMQRFIAAAPNDPKAKTYATDLAKLETLMKDSSEYTVQEATFNTRGSEFGAVRYGDHIYYAAPAKQGKKHRWNDENYLDIYQKSASSKATEVLPPSINSKYHEGIIALTSDKKRMYFDRNNYTNKKFKKDTAGVNQLQIFYADRTGGEFGKAIKAPFNDDNYSTAHPALSPDGKTLYFTSDRPGGHGMGDIWKVAINDDGTFGTPVNAGSTINTPEQDLFPHVGVDETLYFSSNGHFGLGGLDIFRFRESAQKVENLGAPINSSADDFSFKPYGNETEGFFASNRGKRGDDNIYTFNFKQKLPCEPEVMLLITGNDGYPVNDAMVTINSDAIDTAVNIATKESGKITFDSACSQTFDLVISAEGYQVKKEQVLVTGSDVKKSIALVPEMTLPAISATKVLLNPIYFEFNKARITADAAAELDRLVEVMKQNPTMIISAETHSDARGKDSYNLRLSQRRSDAMREYIIEKGIESSRIQAVGRGETDPAIACGENCTEEEFQKNRRTEFIILKN